MRYLLAAALLAATVAILLVRAYKSARKGESFYPDYFALLLALAFSGCATNDRCNDICNSRVIREYDKWVKAAAERDDAKIVAPSPEEQARILREARTVEKIP